MIVLRWQLCEANLQAGGSPAIQRRVDQGAAALPGAHRASHGVGGLPSSGLQAPGEVAGIAALRTAARAHVDAMALNMITGS